MFLNVKQGFPILSGTKTLYPKTLYLVLFIMWSIMCVVYNVVFQCGLCNESYYGESIRHLDIRSGEHIGVSPLTGKKVKPSNNSAICDHLLHCNFLPSFDNFSVLAYETTTRATSVLMQLSRLAGLAIFALICSCHFTRSYASSLLKPYRSRSFFTHSSHDFLGRPFFLFPGISCSMTSCIWELISRRMT